MYDFGSCGTFRAYHFCFACRSFRDREKVIEVFQGQKIKELYLGKNPHQHEDGIFHLHALVVFKKAVPCSFMEWICSRIGAYFYTPVHEIENMKKYIDMECG